MAVAIFVDFIPWPRKKAQSAELAVANHQDFQTFRQQIIGTDWASSTYIVAETLVDIN